MPMRNNSKMLFDTMGEFFQERPYTASAAKASGKATQPHNLSPLIPAPHFLLDTSPILGVCYPPTFIFLP